MIDISIVIPCYEMYSRGAEMLAYSLKKISEQTFKNFEVIVSDDSEDDYIKKVCSDWVNFINIKYFKNPGEKGLSSNLNNAILESRGKVIKVLCQDDFLIDNQSLEKIKKGFANKTKWLVGSYYHTDIERKIYYKQQIPAWNDKIFLLNTIGTHSSLSFVNENPMLFDTNLMWYMDCEYYYRLYKKYGEPVILKDPIVVQCLWEGQTTNNFITQEIELKERIYLINKYGKQN